MRKKMLAIVVALAAPVLVWLGAEAMAASFDHPSLPPGTKLISIGAAKGALTLDVNNPNAPYPATLSFSGTCSDKPVSFANVNVTDLVNLGAFGSKTGDEIAAAITNWFTDNPDLVAPFNAAGCYNDPKQEKKIAIGIYLTTVFTTLNKSQIQWSGVVAVQGVKP